MCRFDYAVPNMQVPTAGVYQGICKTLYNKTLKYMTMQCTGLIRHWLIGRFPERPLPTSLPLPPSHSWVYLPPILLLANHIYMHAHCTVYQTLAHTYTILTRRLTQAIHTQLCTGCQTLAHTYTYPSHACTGIANYQSLYFLTLLHSAIDPG